jgi:hypothetical protein
MIATAAITAALAFWAPMYGGPLPCTADDVHVYDTPPAGVVLPADAVAFAYMTDQDGNPLPPHCDIYISREVLGYPPPLQCDADVHEWGHAMFGLAHVNDPNNVMYPYLGNPPGVCNIPPYPSTSTSFTIPKADNAPHVHRRVRRHLAFHASHRRHTFRRSTVA